MAHDSVPPTADPGFLIRLYGDFRVVDCATGGDATPRSRKARALLGLSCACRPIVAPAASG